MILHDFLLPSLHLCSGKVLIYFVVRHNSNFVDDSYFLQSSVLMSSLPRRGRAQVGCGVNICFADADGAFSACETMLSEP